MYMLYIFIYLSQNLENMLNIHLDRKIFMMERLRLEYTIKFFSQETIIYPSIQENKTRGCYRLKLFEFFFQNIFFKIFSRATSGPSASIL